jgi:hypothetical protein
MTKCQSNHFLLDLYFILRSVVKILCRFPGLPSDWQKPDPVHRNQERGHRHHPHRLRNRQGVHFMNLHFGLKFLDIKKD